MDSARDALTTLCRSHPSQELSRLSSDLTLIAKRTEAVAQRCAKTRGNLQDGLQLHFNGKIYLDFVSGVRCGPDSLCLFIIPIRSLLIVTLTTTPYSKKLHTANNVCIYTSYSEL